MSERASHIAYIELGRLLSFGMVSRDRHVFAPFVATRSVAAPAKRTAVLSKSAGLPGLSNRLAYL